MKKIKKCRRCGIDFEITHANQKRCKACVSYLKKYPNHTMTNDQIKKAKKLIGIKNRMQICEELGVSLSNLKRAFRGVRIPNISEYSKDTIDQVCAYYEIHGERKTAKKFPDCSIRSIIERNYGKFKPRQVRWRDSEIVELAKMAGLVSFRAQAKYFNRPRANDGSIWSVWIKKFKLPSGNLNGMSINQAKHIVLKSCPIVTCKLLKRRDDVKPLGSQTERKILLWVDIEKNLKPDLPVFLKNGIEAMANYQRWLFNSKNPKAEIIKMIKDREIYD